MRARAVVREIYCQKHTLDVLYLVAIKPESYKIIRGVLHERSTNIAAAGERGVG